MLASRKVHIESDHGQEVEILVCEQSEGPNRIGALNWTLAEGAERL